MHFLQKPFIIATLILTAFFTGCAEYYPKIYSDNKKDPYKLNVLFRTSSNNNASESLIICTELAASFEIVEALPSERHTIAIPSEGFVKNRKFFAYKAKLIPRTIIKNFQDCFDSKNHNDKYIKIITPADPYRMTVGIIGYIPQVPILKMEHSSYKTLTIGQKVFLQLRKVRKLKNTFLLPQASDCINLSNRYFQKSLTSEFQQKVSINWGKTSNGLRIGLIETSRAQEITLENWNKKKLISINAIIQNVSDKPIAVPIIPLLAKVDMIDNDKVILIKEYDQNSYYSGQEKSVRILAPQECAYYSLPNKPNILTGVFGKFTNHADIGRDGINCSYFEYKPNQKLKSFQLIYKANVNDTIQTIKFWKGSAKSPKIDLENLQVNKSKKETK